MLAQYNTLFYYFSFCSTAVAVNAKLKYAVVEMHRPLADVSTSSADGKKRVGNFLKEQENSFLIVAEDLVSTLEAKWGVELVIKKLLLGSDLENCRLCERYNFYFRDVLRKCHIF